MSDTVPDRSSAPARWRGTIALALVAWCAIVAGLALGPVATAVAAPTIVGSTPTISDATPQVGQTLTASPGAWSPSTVALAYQWYRGTSKISGATAKRYTVAPADLGLQLKVRVTGAKSGYASTAKYSALTAKVAKGVFTTKPTPTINDTTPTVDQTLTASVGTWAPTPTTFSFQWYRVSTAGAATAITGATSRTYPVAAADKAYRLRVTVTARRSGFVTAATTSALTSAAQQFAFTTAPKPQITGQAQYGGTLGVTLGTWAPTPTAFAYQWKRGDAAIAGATGATYQVGSDDVGASLSVAVTASKAGYLSKTVTSSAVVPVAAGQANDVRVGSFNIYGQNNDSKVSSERRWPTRMPAVAAQILRKDLDVVGLQEASPTTDQAGQLVKALNARGGKYAAATTSAFSNGTKIIYKSADVALVTAGVYKYSAQADTSQYKQRFLTWAVFRSLASGKQFFLADTHLDPYSAKNSTDTIKVAQWRELIAKVPQLNTGNLPVVVVGDFNTSKWWSESKETLPAMKAAGFGDVLNQQYQVNPPVGIRAETVINGWIYSYNGFRADITQYSYSTRRDKIGSNIDWIFATNSLRVKEWETVIDFDPATLTVTGIIPSDHCLLTAVLVI